MDNKEAILGSIPAEHKEEAAKLYTSLLEEKVIKKNAKGAKCSSRNKHEPIFYLYLAMNLYSCCMIAELFCIICRVVCRLS